MNARTISQGFLKTRNLGYLLLISLLLTACETSSNPILYQPQSLPAGLVDLSGEDQSRQCSPDLPKPDCSESISSGCSVFTVSKGDQVFFGGNDDYKNPDSYYWVDPGYGDNYGAIWIGARDNVLQGVNEKGLAYDANGLPRVDTNPHLEREPVSGGYSSYPIQILHECATVQEVIEWVNKHQWHSYMWDQLHFADATGDAVIISAGADGELVFTRKPAGDGYLVSTNFNVANPKNAAEYPCWRYDTATQKLEELMTRAGGLTFQDAVKVLDAVHVEGNSSWTIESIVADLPHGIVYLYYFYQYDKPVVLNVKEEIANARADGPLSKLFPEDVQQEAARRYQRLHGRTDFYGMLGKVWLGLVIASLVVLLVGSIKRRKGLMFWVLVVVILGPVGLLTWLVAGRSQRTGNWQAILMESTGDLLPTVLAFIAVVVWMALKLGASGKSEAFDLVFLGLLFSSPLFIGLLVFQAPLLALAANKSYWRMLLLRLPHTWITANLTSSGIFAIVLPLVNNSLRLPLPLWIAVFWWGLTALSGLVVMLLLCVYEIWSVCRGYRAWTTLARMDGEVVSAPWKKVWWWIPLSYVIIIAGIACYTFIQQALQR